jgi:hypothetical protein
MDNSIKALIGEQSSPLFRIMWVANPKDPSRRLFENNVSAFHIGNGFFLSVAHNLRSECSLLRSIPSAVFEKEILASLNPTQRDVMNQYYEPADQFAVRHIRTLQPPMMHSVTEMTRLSGLDSRWIALAGKHITVPCLIIQFRSPLFYNDRAATGCFNSEHHFFEPSLDRHTFLIPLEVRKAWYENDIALYQAVDAPDEILKKIPAATLDLSLAELNKGPMYCLQSSPAGYIGRLLNTAILEGYLDHYQTFSDRIGGNYHLEGLRYLIRGYFRFGSSGAPYLVPDQNRETFSVNAIQSEASPVQLSINNNREGNYQYVNAIASPLHAIGDELKAITGAPARGDGLTGIPL